MAVKRYNPTSPGRRHAAVLSRRDRGLTEPVRALLSSTKEKAGRNSQGKITVRHQGGGHKRAYRAVDFVNPILDRPGRVVGIQYDPNRSGDVALLVYPSGQKAYTLAVADLKVGDTVTASRTQALAIERGNRMALKHVPAGMVVSNIELFPGRTARVARSAGAGATVLSSDAGFVQVKMPSGEIRKFSGDCLATVGQVSNSELNTIRLGTAGRMRHLGVRPRVRGKAMNPVDHPHGGGEGNTSIGMKRPKTKWGKPAFGVRTRKRHQPSNTLIIRRRKSK